MRTGLPYEVENKPSIHDSSQHFILHFETYFRVISSFGCHPCFCINIYKPCHAGGVINLKKKLPALTSNMARKNQRVGKKHNAAALASNLDV